MRNNIKNKLIQLRQNVRNVVICQRQRIRLKNKNFTLISSNCTGAIITHELKCKFNTPTVNLFICPKEFIKFISNIKEYKEIEMIPDLGETKKRGYPVGILKDITIYGVHYHSFDELKSKWNERFKRVDYKNMFILMSERDGCTYQDLKDFDKLPYKNKIVLTKKEYPEIKSHVYISGFEEENQLGDVFRMRRLLSLTKYYDEFDFVEWLNNNI